MPSPRARVIARVIARLGIVARCPTCGFPEPEPQLAVLLYNGEDLGQCDACGNELDQFGRPVGDGSTQVQVVRLMMDRPAWEAESNPVDHPSPLLDS